MPRLDPHPVLDRASAECVRALADPELPSGTVLPRLDERQAELVVWASRVHATVSTAFRNVRARAPADGPALAAAFDSAEAEILSIVGQTMRLRHWGRKIVAAFADAGIASTIVKGPVLASRLYPVASDRLFGDIDIVVHPDDANRAIAVLGELGYVADDIPNRDAAEHCEFKWIPDTGESVHVELQTNLIHSPRLRQRIWLDFDAILEAGNGDPQEATALLYVAGVHAAMGHQFDRLGLLIDVLQAVRGRAGAIDEERLFRVARRTGTLRAVAASLALVGRMYDECGATELARWLMPGSRPLEWSLVSPAVVMKSQSEKGWRVSWRRKVFRSLIYQRAAGLAGTRKAPAGGA